MTTPTLMIRRIGKGYCAAGDGFYCFDEDLSRVLQRVAEFSRRIDPTSGESATEATEARAQATPKA